MKELLIDFSSSPFLVTETATDTQPAVIAAIVDEVSIVAEGAKAALAEEPGSKGAQIIPALRKNFPAIQRVQLRSLCWQAIFGQLVPDRKMTQPDEKAGVLKVHAIFPQTWRATEAEEFRATLQARGMVAGYIASETACLAVLIEPELRKLRTISAPDPIKVVAAVRDHDDCRWWSFEWFRASTPELLCLTDHAPAFARDCAPACSRPEILITLGNPGITETELARLKITNAFTVKCPSDSPLLQGASIMLRHLAGLTQPAEAIRLETAPSLAWRWSARSHVTALSSTALLDSSCFPVMVEKKCSYVAGRDDWDNVSFWIEAVWGKAPESWSPLASVQLPAELLHSWKQSKSKPEVRLKLQMPTPASGKISLETTGSDGSPFHDCAEFTLGSALA